MSGGYFDYHQGYITDIADSIKKLIEINDDKSLNEWGDPVSQNYSPEVIAKFKKGLAHLRLAAIYVQRIDWLVSGDDGEKTFLTRLEEDLRRE